MKRLTILPILALTLMLSPDSPATAQEDVRKVKLNEPHLQVIEEKCLVCHNRKRIDDAVAERKDMEMILRVMEKKGAVLTDTERGVMGHFWYQHPFKKK